MLRLESRFLNATICLEIDVRISALSWTGRRSSFVATFNISSSSLSSVISLVTVVSLEDVKSLVVDVSLEDAGGIGLHVSASSVWKLA